MKSLTYSVTREKMVEEAERRGWKVRYFGPEDHFYEITALDGRSCIFRGSSPQTSSAIGASIAAHKLYALDYLKHIGITPPPYALFTTDEAAEMFLQKHHQIVVKPEDAEQSKGVTVGITDTTKLRKAVAVAREFSKEVILQQQLAGRLYRLLTIGGKFYAAVDRCAAFVVGDGERTIKDLIAEKNAHPLRGDLSSSPLKKIKLEPVSEYLAAHNRTLDDIPLQDERVELSAIASVSVGGEAADVTEQVHSGYIRIIEHIAQKLNIVSCGLDLITPDISRPPESTVFPVIEFNSLPGFKMHYYPTAGGVARDPARALFETVFDADA